MASIPRDLEITATLTARDATGDQEASGGLAVAFGLGGGRGAFGPVLDNGDGIYSAAFTATTAETAVVAATIGGQAVGSTARIEVMPTARLSLGPATLATARLRRPYQWTFSPSGDSRQYRLSLQKGGKLPGGLSLSRAGVLGGKPRAAGTYRFTVLVTDRRNPALNGTASYQRPARAWRLREWPRPEPWGA